jgi:hypothetical protein
MSRRLVAATAWFISMSHPHAWSKEGEEFNSSLVTNYLGGGG